MKDMNHATLTADEILAIPETAPERLFAGPDADAIKKVVRSLSMKWHTDRNTDPRAGAVFDRVQKLSDAATGKLAAGTWETPGLLRITSTAGAAYELRYASKLTVDVGTMYVGRTAVGFDITSDNLDLLQNAERQLAGLSYANDTMRGEFARYFPEVSCKVDTPTGAMLILSKTPDVLLLQDVLAHYQGKMPPRHAAWVISRLLNIACYLERQGKVAHNAIGPDTVFISPKHHSACLLGGWWFTTGLGERLLAAPQRMVLSAPPDVLQKKVGDTRTDMEMIKALGRELLGDATGVRLANDSAVPPALVDWLQLSTHQSAVATYREWQERVLIDAFGARKFVEMNITHDTLYA
jgi:hypothetical protein